MRIKDKQKFKAALQMAVDISEGKVKTIPQFTESQIRRGLAVIGELIGDLKKVEKFNPWTAKAPIERKKPAEVKKSPTPKNAEKQTNPKPVRSIVPAKKPKPEERERSLRPKLDKQPTLIRAKDKERKFSHLDAVAKWLWNK